MKKLFLVGIFAVFFFSCQTQKTDYSDLPDWILKLPDADENEYFSASGSSKDLGEAEAGARENLIMEISRYLGASIKTSSVAELSGNIENLEKVLYHELKQNSQANVQGFKIVEKYFQKTENGTTVFLLGAYNKKSLELEKRRLQALIRERENSIAEPERKADKFFEIGSFFKAVQFYLEAAQACVDSGLDNSDLRFNKNIQKAKLSLQAIEFNFENEKNFQINKTLKIKANISELPLKIYYTIVKNNSQKRSQSKLLYTDELGFASFSFPENLKGAIFVEIDSSFLSSITNVQAGKGLQNVLNQKTLKLYYNEKTPLQVKQNINLKLNIKGCKDEDEEIYFRKLILNELSKNNIRHDENSKTVVEVNISFNPAVEEAGFYLVQFLANLKVNSLSDFIQKRAAAYTEAAAHESALRLASKIIAENIFSKK